jgi:hypothetical protein
MLTTIVDHNDIRLQRPDSDHQCRPQRHLVSADGSGPGVDPRQRTYALLIRLPASGEEDPLASESAFSALTRWLTWPASDACVMRMSSLITTLNPMAETTNPARLIQSRTLIVTGSSALIIERGRATLTLFLCHPMFCVLCDPMFCAGRDLRAHAVSLLSAISQPPIAQATVQP